MIRVICALLCLLVLPSCNTSSAGNLLMMPLKLGNGILKTATRTLGRMAEADSQAPNPEPEAMPKPHTRLPTQSKPATSEAPSRLAATLSASPST